MPGTNPNSQQVIRHHSEHTHPYADDLDYYIDTIGRTVRESLVVLDQELRVYFANRVFSDLLQIDAAGVKGSYFYELSNRVLDTPEVRRLLEELLLSVTVVDDFEVTQNLANGGVRSLLINARVIDRESQPRFTLLVIKESVTPISASAMTWQDQSLLALMIENAPVPLAMFDTEMRYLVASRRWINDYQLSKDNLYGRCHYDLFPGMISEEWKLVHRRGLAGENIRNDEDRFVRQDGSIQWLRWEVKPWYKADNTVGGIVIFAEDITTLRCAANAARENRGKLLAALNSMSDAVFISDATGRIVEFNEACLKLHRLRDRDEVFAKLADYQSVLEISLPDGTAVPVEMWAVPRALRGETGIGVEYHLRRKDSGESWIGSYNFAPIRDGDGNIVGSVVVGRDITSKVQAERTLHAIRSELALEVSGLTRLNAASSVLWRTRDLSGGLQEMLQATIDIMSADFGNIQLLDPDRQVLTIAVQQGYCQEFLDVFREVNVADACACGRALRSHKRLIIEDVEVDEEYAPFRDVACRSNYRAMQSTPLLSPQGEPLGMISTHWRLPHRPTHRELARLDLFARQTAEFIWRVRMDQQLHQQEAMVNSILDTAADAIITVDGQGLIVRINTATESMFGYQALDLVGQSVSLLMPTVTSQELRAILNQQAKIGFGLIADNKREFLGVRNGGGSFPLELSVSKVDHLEIYTIIIRDITVRCRLQREVVTIAESEQRKIGQELHDSAQQELTAVSLLARVLLDHLNGHSADTTQATLKRCAVVAEKILSGVKRANEEVRQISHGLLPVQLDSEGLVNALQELALQTDALKSVTCTFSSSRPVEIAEAVTATHLFKIAQEAVTNCLKHAHAKHICIELETEESAIVLRISDDGVGVNGQHAHGVGLRSMEYRAHLINGILRLTNRTQGGSLLTCTVFNRDSRNYAPPLDESDSQQV